LSAKSIGHTNVELYVLNVSAATGVLCAWTDTQKTQRPMFEGKLRSCVDVNGKTIHVVQRSPPSARAASGAGPSSSAAEPGRARDERPRMDGSNFVVGSFSLPPDASDVNQVHVSNKGYSSLFTL